MPEVTVPPVPAVVEGSLELKPVLPTIPLPKKAAATYEFKCVAVNKRIMQVQVLEEDGGLHACMRDGALVLFELCRGDVQSHPIGLLSLELLGVVPFEKGMHYKLELIP